MILHGILYVLISFNHGMDVFQRFFIILHGIMYIFLSLDVETIYATRNILLWGENLYIELCIFFY